MRRLAIALILGLTSAHGCSIEETGQAGNGGAGFGGSGVGGVISSGGGFPDAQSGGGMGGAGGTSGGGGGVAGSGATGGIGGTGGTSGTGASGGTGGMGASGGAGGTGGTGGDAGVAKPTDFPGLLLWLRADVGVVTVGNSVITWTDQSGKNNHYAQGNAALQPTLVNNAWKNKPGVRFAGGSKALVGMGLGAISKLTLLMALRADHVPAPNEYFELFNDSSANGGFRIGLATASAYNSVYFGVFTSLVRAPLAQLDTTMRVFVVTWNGGSAVAPSSYELWVDGLSFSVENTLIPGIGAPSNSIGAFAEGNPLAFQGDLFEIAAYNSELSASERAALSTLVAQDWSK